MDLKREVISKLLKWKDSPSRLPLIIRGARQCGKSWSMKEFGRLYYENTAYFNFEKDPQLKGDFKTKDPKRLLPLLELYAGCKIRPETTLIIFDEIQECNEALNSLKYFAELAPEYHIISAGSLLGVALNRSGSFPVGKVDFIDMYPLTFKEFLWNADDSLFHFVDGMDKLEPIPSLVYNNLQVQFKRYSVCGGMPKAVVAMLEDNDLQKVDEELRRIAESYSLDFSKHASPQIVPRITEIWNSLPSQLAKENRKFIFKLVRPGARAREYEIALQWLQLAGLVYKVNDTENPFMPLSAYDNVSAFKIYLLDVGILRTISGLPAQAITNSSAIFREFKGVLAENCALQSLVPQFQVMPRYWTSRGRAEVDFIIQGKENIVPLEVKAENNLTGKSLSVYIKKYSPKLAITVSSLNVSIGEPVVNIPHSLTGWINKLLDF